MECSICLAVPQNPMTMDCCKNTYCYKCITQWVQIRNICPLCCTVTAGQQQQNSLKLITNQQFDDGFLMIQTQIKQTLNQINMTQARILNKKYQMNNQKSVISKSMICYVDKEFEKLKIYRACMEEQYLLNNRSSAVQFLQLATESIHQIQYSLDNNVCYEEFSQQSQQQQQDECSYDDQYYEYEYAYEKNKIYQSKQQKINSSNKQNAKLKIIKEK